MLWHNFHALKSEAVLIMRISLFSPEFWAFWLEIHYQRVLDVYRAPLMALFLTRAVPGFI